MSPERPNWDEYFLGIAKAVSARADCTRRQVGAVIVKDRRIVATGYNGGPAGGKSCLKGECPRGLLSLSELPPGASELPSSYDTGAGSCIALHAEQNAVMYSDQEDRRDATIYVTDEPCGGCLRMLRGSQLLMVVYRREDGMLEGVLLN
jgi:dCMP deaminase